MAAAEHPPHLATELLGDLLAGQPPAGAVGEGDVAVSVVGFRADDDDPVARDVVEGGEAAGGEVGSVDDEQVGGEVVEGSRE